MVLKIALELSDSEAMQSGHAMQNIHLKFGNWSPAAKTLIEYNSKTWSCAEEKMSQLILSLLSKTLVMKIMKMLLLR